MTAAVQAANINESNAQNASKRLKEREPLNAMIEAEGGTPIHPVALLPVLGDRSSSDEVGPAQGKTGTTDQQNKKTSKQSRVGRMFRSLMCGGRIGAGKNM